VVQSINPFHRSRSLDNQIILAVVNEHGQLFVQQVFHSIHLRLHEVSPHIVVNLFRVLFINDFRVEFINICADTGVSKVRLQ